MNVQEQFLNACRDGNLELAQQLFKNNPTIDISADNELTFQYACYYGYLQVAQWLLEVKPTINISADNEYAFQLACKNKHLELAQWLLTVKPNINISAINNCAFKNSCYNEHLQVALWLCSLKPFKYYIKIEDNNIISNKINTECQEKLLFVLYSLTNKGYTNNLTPDLLTNISKYL